MLPYGTRPLLSLLTTCDGWDAAFGEWTSRTETKLINTPSQAPVQLSRHPRPIIKTLLQLTRPIGAAMLKGAKQCRIRGPYQRS